jgi:hypothetical protein
MATKKKNHSKKNPFWNEGDAYFIRTVTSFFTGRLICIDGPELIFTDCCWIADTGRFADALAKGVVNESEPFPKDQPVLVNRESIVDATPWTHALILVQK